jgi:hypothetical protein
MTYLKCKRVAHALYSPDLAMVAFHLFNALKQALQDIDASDEEELKSEILTIFQGIPSDELEKSFDH